MESERNSAEAGNTRLLERMLYFSDAVFAIVLTLLVLDLRLPAGVTDASLLRGVLEMAPKLVAFAITFALVAVFWIAHVSITRRLNAFDWPVAWVNMLFLFTVTLAPFVTTLLGAYGVFGNAWRLYCVALIAIGSAQFALFLVIYRGNGRLIGGMGRREFLHRLIRVASPAASFAVLLALNLMGFTRMSFILSFLIVPTILVLVRFSFGRRP
jgi:TMEM175 potassium channel family protein